MKHKYIDLKNVNIINKNFLVLEALVSHHSYHISFKSKGAFYKKNKKTTNDDKIRLINPKILIIEYILSFESLNKNLGLFLLISSNYSTSLLSNSSPSDSALPEAI